MISSKYKNIINNALLKLIDNEHEVKQILTEVINTYDPENHWGNFKNVIVPINNGYLILSKNKIELFDNDNISIDYVDIN